MLSPTNGTNRTATRLTALAVTCAASVALSACSGQRVSTSSAALVATAPSSEATTSDAVKPSGAAGSAAPVRKPLNYVVKDDVLGNTIAFTSVVRSFPVPDTFEALQEDGELVLVEIDAKAGSPFSGGVQGGWTLVTEGSVAPVTTIVDEAMTAAGYTPFNPPSSGRSAKGWVAFQVNQKAAGYRLVYTRSAATVIGSGEVIPARTWEFPLT